MCVIRYKEYKLKNVIDPQTRWNDLAEVVECAQEEIKNACASLNLGVILWNELEKLSKWKLYQLHKGAQKTQKNRSIKAGSFQEGSDPAPAAPSRPRPYDPVRDG